MTFSHMKPKNLKKISHHTSVIFLLLKNSLTWFIDKINLLRFFSQTVRKCELGEVRRDAI